MLERIRTWLTPTSSDFDLAYRQFILNVVLVGLAVPGFFFGISILALWALGRTPLLGALIGLGVQPFYFLSYWLCQRERIRLAAHIPVGVVFLGMAAATFVLGVGHVTTIGMAMAVTVAGVLIGLPASLLFMLLSVAVYLSAGMLQAAGMLRTAVSPARQYLADSIGLGFGLSVLVILIWLANRELLRALKGRRVHQAALESERRYSALVENISLGAYRSSIEHGGSILLANPAFMKMFGMRSEEDLKRFRLVDLHQNPQDRDRFLEQLAARGRVSGVELPLQRVDGEPIWGSVTAHIVELDEQDGAPHIDGMIEDVTQRKQAEEALRESQRALTTLMGNLPGMAYRCQNNRQWTMEFVSQGCLSLTGYESEELLYDQDVSYGELIHREDRESVWQGVQSALARDERFELVYRIHTKSGEEKWVWEQGCGVFDPDGEVVALEGFINDVTQAHNTELELRAANRRLESALESLEKTQRRVILQERLAAVGQLAAGIAHDFSNALMPIMLYGEAMLRASDLSPDNRKRVETILQQARHATTLTQQILDFGRRGLMRLEVIDLKELLEGFSQLLRRTLPESIDLTFEAGDGSYAINGDRARIQQALMNLAINARDAMPDGGRLDIQLSDVRVREGEAPPYRDMPPGRWLVVRFEDSGEGIHPAQIGHIFEPFFTTKDPGAGSGLGLAQVYGIVKQHGGYIKAESELDVGACFTIYFPAVYRFEQESAPAQDLDFRAIQHETILVVEDDLSSRQALSEILESMDYQVLQAATGRKALELYRPGEVDLVISDLIMPQMGGLELLIALREVDPNVKLAVLTGYPLEEGGQNLLEEGIVAWAHKPLNFDGIARLVRDGLRARDGSS